MRQGSGFFAGISRSAGGILDGAAIDLHSIHYLVDTLDAPGIALGPNKRFTGRDIAAQRHDIAVGAHTDVPSEESRISVEGFTNALGQLCIRALLRGGLGRARGGAAHRPAHDQRGHQESQWTDEGGTQAARPVRDAVYILRVSSYLRSQTMLPSRVRCASPRHRCAAMALICAGVARDVHIPVLERAGL